MTTRELHVWCSFALAVLLSPALAGAVPERYVVMGPPAEEAAAVHEIARGTRARLLHHLRHVYRLQDPSRRGATLSAVGTVVEMEPSSLSSMRARHPRVRIDLDPVAHGAQFHAAGIEVFAIQTPSWGATRVRALEAHATSRGAGVTVCVVDSGVQRDHPDLMANILPGRNFVYRSGDPAVNPDAWDDDQGHGTHVSGIIAALDNEFGIVGVAPDAHILPMKVLNSFNTGFMSDIAEAVRSCTDRGAHVINLSLQGSDYYPLMWAIEAAQEAGIIVVAAAGNEAGAVTYPGAYPGVIAVSALGYYDVLEGFSSFGPEVSFTAPGSGIFSTYLGGRYYDLSGTSMSSPHVAGVAALVLANQLPGRVMRGVRVPGLTPEQQGQGVIDAVLSLECPTAVCEDQAPTVTLSVPSLTSDAALTVTGTLGDDALVLSDVTVLVNGAPTSLGPRPRGPFSATVNLVAGSNTVAVQVTDSRGHVATASAEVFLDMVPPSVSFDLTPRYVNTPTREVTVRATDNHRLTDVWITVGPAFLRLRESSVAGTWTGVVTLREGANTLRLQAVDLARNQSSVSQEMVLDTVAPDLSILSPVEAQVLGAPTTTVSVRFSDATPTTVSAQGTAYVVDSGDAQLASGPYEFAAEGPGVVTVTATDAAGNTRTASVGVLVDLQAPVLSIDVAGGVTGPLPGDLLPFNLRVDALSATTVGFSFESSTRSLPRGGGVVAGAAPLREGPNRFTVTATNELGRSASLTVDVTYDLTAPTGRFTSPAPDAVVGRRIDLSVDATDDLTGVASVSFAIDGDAGPFFAGVWTGDAWRLPLDTTALADGPHVAYARLVDTAGNARTLSTRFEVDNTSPSVAITSPVANTTVTRSMDVTARVADAHFASVECSVDGASLGASTTPTFSRTFSLLETLDGVVEVRCVAHDLVGNSAVATSSVTVRNWTVRVEPETIRLREAIGPGAVSVRVEGVNVSLLLPVGVRALTLRMAGGRPVPALTRREPPAACDRDTDHVRRVTLRFDRRIFVRSIREGLEAGTIDPTLPVPVRLFAGERDVGGDAIRVRR